MKKEGASLLSKSKRAQMEMSFGMIFSIILIVVFLGFAFYAIKTFLAFQDNAKAGKFYDGFQADVTTIWNYQGSSEREYLVPSSADFVCFIDFSSSEKGVDSAFYSELKRADYGSENLAFYPVKFTGFESANIEHLNIEKTTENENPLCIKTSNGKVILTLKKDFGEALVTISK